jgi:FKBP-type peptidyl-prolyl cis-trans isomerase
VCVCVCVRSRPLSPLRPPAPPTRAPHPQFKVGLGQVIKGWDVGMATMKKGERAILTISSDYGYGADGYPPVIPENATLYFDVEVIDFK